MACIGHLINSECSVGCMLSDQGLAFMIAVHICIFVQTLSFSWVWMAYIYRAFKCRNYLDLIRLRILRMGYMSYDKLFRVIGPYIVPATKHKKSYVMSAMVHWTLAQIWFISCACNNDIKRTTSIHPELNHGFKEKNQLIPFTDSILIHLWHSNAVIAGLFIGRKYYPEHREKIEAGELWQ